MSVQLQSLVCGARNRAGNSDLVRPVILELAWPTPTTPACHHQTSDFRLQTSRTALGALDTGARHRRGKLREKSMESVSFSF